MAWTKRCRWLWTMLRLAWLWLAHTLLRRPLRKRFFRNPKGKPLMRRPCKPAWTVDVLIRIHQETGLSARKVADTFNGRYEAACGVRVGKTFVAQKLKAFRYEADRLSERFKHRVPPPLPRNKVWGVDMTGKGDASGTLHAILGVIDYGSRMALAMHALPDRTALTLLKALIAVIECRGKPDTIKTDNEACFTSRLFRFGLAWLGIRHQRSQPGKPWQNGRVERLFGTLKEKLDQLVVQDALGLRQALSAFQFWYNDVRPHQHLGGWTPWEAWHGVNPYTHAPKSIMLFKAWDGLLTGYYMRR